ncbi:hypothetical protein HK099_005138 [Clydaea vesicula]|uniref:Protein arginine N-methyltransferase n=1 Tax=Clydaea vesicula TaxID=447962 RepID=A0AAD5U7X2_9FUNG|nr:hypothetical protein HK099_005138 [Clydaea vesicula]
MAKSLSVGLEIISKEDDLMDNNFFKNNNFNFAITNLKKVNSDGYHLNTTVIDDPYSHVGKVSSIENLFSNDPVLLQSAESKLKRELEWAAFLGITCVLFPVPLILSVKNVNEDHINTRIVMNFARFINSMLNNCPYINIWIRIPASSEQGWETFSFIKSVCEDNVRLSVVLELNSQEEALKKWFAEPVSLVIVKTSCFLSNNLKYPALKKCHQQFLALFMEVPVRLALSSESTNPVGNKGGISAYLDYIWYLYNNLPTLSEQDALCRDYYDVVMVVGAGRGPLVQNSLNAANRSGRKVKIYALDKNPNAYCDILISELLGSFGDNELSPECLDGAQKFLKSSGISIPCSYTSYLNPISSTKLHQQVSTLPQSKLSNYVNSSYETGYVVKIHRAVHISKPQKVFTYCHPYREKNFETRLGHENFNLHNNRYEILKFNVDGNSIGKNGIFMHGMAGYFHATLYKDVFLSTHPDDHSKDMNSWFPIYFPIKTPMYLSANGEVEIHIWRRTDSNKVWYEWCVSSAEKGGQSLSNGPLQLHNGGGRSSWIGLQG